MSAGGEKSVLWRTVMHQEACLVMANGDSRRQTLSYTDWVEDFSLQELVKTMKNGENVYRYKGFFSIEFTQTCFIF